MLITQSYHSIFEIDPEFIPSIEHLLKEDVPSFEVLKERHETAPDTDVFTYFLFFGPTQNTPVGFAQLTLRKIPWQRYLPWWKRILFFWRRDHLHWKEAIWKVIDGSPGLYVFDPRFLKSGREKVSELIADYESRGDIKARQLYCTKGWQEPKSVLEHSGLKKSEFSVLEPFPRSSKTYEDYLLTLQPETSKKIKLGWKELHEKGSIFMGDYPSADHLVKVELPENLRKKLISWNAQVLTFERGSELLGCIAVFRGKEGNIFCEPFPFEPQEAALVNDELYIQYALYKFFEIPEARRCHLMKNGEKLFYQDKDDVQFILDQGFTTKTISTFFSSEIPGLESPL